ncbi:uncharacterized protein [Choristoneura fumiferana]|uniref:uncharacterized protein n=1 Tax=Choristoneura fumiferana TaxID=7141 RepID=UPI003D15B241
MLMKSNLKKCFVFAVIFLCMCEGRRKIKREIDSASDVRNHLHDRITNSSGLRKPKGFFPPGGLFTLGKVLNFFPVGGERECQPSGYRTARAGICLNPYDCRQREGQSAGDCAHGLGVCCVFFTGGLFTLGKVLNFFPVGGERECQPSGYRTARAGICLNPYDCRQREGQSAGDCAHGLGVCCVFEVSCGGTVQNNLTYFISPGFPELWTEPRDCEITIEKTHAGVMQLRIDFVHFAIGQPNRLTGECDEDVMVLGDRDNEFRICGQNHGQHIYYTLPTGSETREAGDLPSTASTRLSVRMRGADMPRLWLLRLAQMPLAHAAPHDCRQYYTANNGTIKTFNYAVNGRYLADQEYKACVRKNKGMCSVRYSPCDNRSFRIGTQGDQNTLLEAGPGGLGGPGTGFYGPDGAFAGPVATPELSPSPALDQGDLGVDTMNDMVADDTMLAEDPQVQEDEMEGSGADPQIAPAIQPTPVPSMASRIWSYIWPPWLWQWQSARTISWSRWSPYAQHFAVPEDDKFRYSGYGLFGIGLAGRQGCKDRITIPCENEYFVSSSSVMSGVCDPHHCGSSFCPNKRPEDCHVDTSISPFAVSVHFGPPSPKPNPEENIGACLRYTQMPCET